MGFLNETAGSDTVGAVIVHFHRECDVARLIEQLTVRDGVPSEHVVLVDNGSDEDLLAAELSSRNLSPVILTPGNVGYAAGMNLGAAKLPRSVETIVLLTHEVELDPSAIDLLAATVAREPRAVVGPLLLSDPTTIWSAGGVLNGVRRLPGHRLQGVGPSEAGVEPFECSWLDGAVLALSAATWRDLGGLDERYFLYGEDIDLGLRARASGHTVLMVPAARATQSPSASIDPYLWTRNPFLLFHAHRLWAAWILWLASCLTGMARDLRKPRETQVRRRLAAAHDGIVGTGGLPPAKPS